MEHNVSKIIREHDNRTTDGKIPAHLILDGFKEIIEKGIEFTKKKNVDIIEIDGFLQKETLTFLRRNNFNQKIADNDNLVLIKEI